MQKKILVWVAVAVVAAIAVLALALPAPAVRKDIDGAELLRLQAAGASIVDVRTTYEFEGGHITSAVNVPVETVQQAAATWDKDQAIVVYCATGARSDAAATTLAGMGFRKVYNLKQGVEAWTGELVTGAATAAPPKAGGTVATAGKPLFIEFSTST